MKAPSRKTWLGIGIGITVLCVVVVTLLSFVVRSNWFLEQAREQLERGVGRTITFSSLTPSLWFGVGVRARDFILYEEDGHTPCIQAESILLRVRILPLLWKSLNVSTISIERPRVAAVRRRDGTWNFESLFKKEKPSAEKEVRPRPAKKKAAFKLSIASLRVRDGIVTASDPAWTRQVVLKDLNVRAAHIAEGALPWIDGGGRLEGVPLAELVVGVKELRDLTVRGGAVSGPLSVRGWAGEKLAFRADLDASDVHLVYRDIYKSPAEGLHLRIKAQGEGSFKGGGWEVRKASAECFEGKLTARGAVRGIGRVPEFTLEVSGRGLSWKELGETKIPGGLALEGTAALGAAVKGTKDDMNVDCTLDLRGSALRYGSYFNKSAGIPAGLTFPFHRSGGVVRWQNAAVRLGELRLTSEGSFDRAAGDKLKSRLNGHSLDLGECNRFFETGIILRGSGEVDISMEHSMGKPFTGASLAGTVKVANGEIRFPDLLKPVSYNAVTAFTPGSVKLGMSTVRIGSSVGEGYLNFDLRRWPAFDCELNFPHLDVADFTSAKRSRGRIAMMVPFLSASKAEAALSATTGERAALPPLARKVAGSGKVTVGELRVGKLRSRDGRGVINVAHGVATLDEVRLPFYGGETQGKLIADLNGPDPRYTLASSMVNVDLAALLSEIYGYSQAVTGTLSAECAATAEGRGWPAVKKALKAKGSFSVKECRLASFGLLRQVGPLMLLLGQQAKIKELAAMGESFSRAPEETRFSRCEGTFMFDGDSWGTGDLMAEIDDRQNPLRLHLEGEIGVGGELSFLGYVSFPRGSRFHQQLAPYFPDDGGWIELPFPVPIGGTLDHPRVDLDASQESVITCAAEIGKLRLRKELEKKIDRALEPKPAKGGGVTPEDVGRELLKGASKELLKQMMKQ